MIQKIHSLVYTYKNWKQGICISMFISAWFTITQRWKEPKGAQMNKQNVIYTYNEFIPKEE
jgi:hypothetical protein